MRKNEIGGMGQTGSKSVSPWFDVARGRLALPTRSKACFPSSAGLSQEGWAIIRARCRTACAAKFPWKRPFDFDHTSRWLANLAFGDLLDRSVGVGD